MTTVGTMKFYREETDVDKEVPSDWMFDFEL